MRHEIDDEDIEKIDKVVAKIFTLEEREEKAKKTTLNHEHDALTSEEISEATREYKSMKKFLGDLLNFLDSNEEHFPDSDVLRNRARHPAWNDRKALEALGFSEYREDCRLFYIPTTLFEEMIFPLQPQHCLGFLLSRNMLHSENGQIVFRRWFKGLKTEFYVIRDEKQN
jgi:hypothetical protein